MAFFKRCAYRPCSKIIMVQLHILNRKKYCSKDCMNKDRRGKSCSPDTEFKRGHRPQTQVPVGSESKTKEYITVKVAEPNVWRQRSHIVWEEASGRQLPDGWIVRRVDGDPANDAPDNLIAMSRGQHLVETLNNPEIEKHKREQTSKALKRRWKEFRKQKREKELEQYDSYYWQ